MTMNALFMKKNKSGLTSSIQSICLSLESGVLFETCHLFLSHVFYQNHNIGSGVRSVIHHTAFGTDSFFYLNYDPESKVRCFIKNPVAGPEWGVQCNSLQ